MANSYVKHYHEDLKVTFPGLDRWESSSFWMSRKPRESNDPAKQTATVKLKENNAI